MLKAKLVRFLSAFRITSVIAKNSRSQLLFFYALVQLPRLKHKEKAVFRLPLIGGHAGRDALRKSHGAAFLAKAREEAMLQAVESPEEFRRKCGARIFARNSPY